MRFIVFPMRKITRDGVYETLCPNIRLPIQFRCKTLNDSWKREIIQSN